MLKKSCAALFLLIGGIGLNLLFAISVTAVEPNSNQHKAEGFSFEVVKPDKQKNKEVGYFDLQLAPKAKETVQMKLMNTSEKELKIAVALNNAKTNSSGVIEYVPSKILDDASLKYKFSTIVKAPKEVTLAPQSTVMLDLEITMPQTSFKGYISGGIQLEEKNQAGEETQGMIVNKFSYLTGMLLSNSDVFGIEPELLLNSVSPKAYNFRNAIMVNFSNVQPVYVNDMRVKVEIMPKKSEEILYSTKKTDMRMAPNSGIDFPISLVGDKMVAGDYRAKILVTTLAGGRWEWEEPFTIKAEEADKFNEQDLSLVQKQGFNWEMLILMAGIVVLVLLIIGSIIFLIGKKSIEDEGETK